MTPRQLITGYIAAASVAFGAVLNGELCGAVSPLLEGAMSLVCSGLVLGSILVVEWVATWLEAAAVTRARQ